MSKNLILTLVGLAVLATAVAVYLLVFSDKKNPVEVLEGLTSDIEVPATNPLENKVPELNPVEKFNPFKYENPLR